MSSTTPPPYTPPVDMLTATEQRLAKAYPGHIALTTVLYATCCGVTGGRSAVTGAELPPFEKRPVLVRAGWLAVGVAINTPVASVVPPAPKLSPVHVVLNCLGNEGGTRRGEVRPAVVVALPAPDPMTPNIQVLGDGPSDNSRSVRCAPRPRQSLTARRWPDGYDAAAWPGTACPRWLAAMGAAVSCAATPGGP